MNCAELLKVVHVGGVGAACRTGRGSFEKVRGLLDDGLKFRAKHRWEKLDGIHESFINTDEWQPKLPE